MPSHDATITVQVVDLPTLEELARSVAAALPRRAFVALGGDLGAGKTTFVKAIAAAVAIDPATVISPTFGLIHDHEGGRDGHRLRLVHADLYRLGGLDELRELGWEDCLAGDPGGLLWAFVEWPERIAAALPHERLDIAIEIVSDEARRFTFTAHGPLHHDVIAAIATIGLPPTPPRPLPP